MPARRWPKHEAFAAAVAAGVEPKTAYLSVGFKCTPKSAISAGGKLSKRADVRARIDELIEGKRSASLAEVQKALSDRGVDREWVIDQLVEIVGRCMAGGDEFNARDATRALELLGKEQGMFIDRREVRDMTLENMSDEELREIVEAAARGEEPTLPTPRAGGSRKPKLISSR